MGSVKIKYQGATAKAVGLSAVTRYPRSIPPLAQLTSEQPLRAAATIPGAGVKIFYFATYTVNYVDFVLQCYERIKMQVTKINNRRYLERSA